MGCAFPSEAGKRRVDDGLGASSRFLHREQPVGDLLHALVGTPHAERGQLRGIGLAGDSVDGLGLPLAESGRGDRGAAIIGAGVARRKDGQRERDEPDGEEPVPTEIRHAGSQPENLLRGKNAAASPWKSKGPFVPRSQTASAGTTNVNSVLGSGTSAVSATGTGTTLKFGSVSQTLSSLSIGAGSTVTFTSGLASFSGGGGKGASLGGGAVVPEPGTLGLLLVGAVGVLNRRRRQAANNLFQG